MSPVAVGLLLVVGIGVLVALVLNLYVRPLRRLAREVRLIAAANPDHRIDAYGPVRGRVADAVNELADRSQAAQQDVEAKIAAATADLERERNRLAALMSELTIAVVVCNADGQILLYNEAAGRVLASSEGATGLIGLGRSIFGIFDRSLIAHAIERIRQGADGGSGGPAVRLTATASAGQLLRVGMAPVLDHGGDITGFVLTMDDVTRRAESSGRRDVLLRSLTEGTRASMGTIRAAIESLLDYPEMGGAERQRFMAIIRDEAVGLGSRLDEALQESAGDLRSEWPLEEVLGRDLVTAIQRALEGELGATATAAETEDDLWLSVDSYAVVEGVAYLAGRLRADMGVAGFSLELSRGGLHAHLDLGWKGQPLDQETLGAWAEQPLRLGGGGREPMLKDVVERHGGEVWCQEDRQAGSASVRMLLPIADEVPGDRPEAARPAGAPAQPSAPLAGSRPELYDFDLFRATELGTEWDERRLGELAYTVFDTETTGLDPSAGDEIVSVGAVRIVNGRLLRRETFDRLVNPRRPISPASVRVHRISADMVRDQPTIEEVLPDFARFASDTVLVGHNVAFDMRFLELKEAQTGVRLRQPVLDTLLLSAAVHPDEEDHSLEGMAARLGVSVVGRHTALGDAILTGEIFLKQLRLLAAQGTDTLGEAREAARRTYLARVGSSLYSRP